MGNGGEVKGGEGNMKRIAWERERKKRKYEGYAREEEWEGEGEERAAAWCAIRLWYLEWLTSAFLIGRSVSECKGLFPLGLGVVDSQASPLTKYCELDVNSASYL